MSPQIDIDEELFGAIKAEAEPFTDTPNSVLRRKYGLDSPEGEPSQPRAVTVTPPKISRAPAGSLLPESEYELPILQVLDERGGSAPAREVTAEVGERLKDRLTDLDRQPLVSGDVRWENRVAFTRLTLKERGLLKADSPRGVWELTDKGRARAEAGEV